MSSLWKLFVTKFHSYTITTFILFFCKNNKKLQFFYNNLTFTGVFANLTEESILRFIRKTMEEKSLMNQALKSGGLTANKFCVTSEGKFLAFKDVIDKNILSRLIWFVHKWRHVILTSNVTRFWVLKLIICHITNYFIINPWRNLWTFLTKLIKLFFFTGNLFVTSSSCQFRHYIQIFRTNIILVAFL